MSGKKQRSSPWVSNNLEVVSLESPTGSIVDAEDDLSLVGVGYANRKNRQTGFNRELSELSASVSDIKSELVSQTKIIDNLERQLNDATAKVRSTSRRSTKTVEDTKKAVAEMRNSAQSNLAIYVGLFTFISIGFQIFATVKDHELWVPLIYVLAGFLIAFSCIIILSSTLSRDNLVRTIFTVIMLVLSIISVTYGSSIYQSGLDLIKNKNPVVSPSDTSSIQEPINTTPSDR